MTPAASDEPRAFTRLKATAAQLGFTPPPVALRLKLLEGPSFWSLFVQPVADGHLGEIVAWLDAWAPLRIEFGSRRVLRADFDPLPPAWLARYRSLEVNMMLLRPDGAAMATLAGPQTALAAFARTIGSSPGFVVKEVGESPRDLPLLTDAQDAALRAAVAAGYYRIPRLLNLRQLGAAMGTSPASLSERLRRAEGRVLTRYVQAGAATPWDARTIFEAHGPDPREPGVQEIDGSILGPT